MHKTTKYLIEDVEVEVDYSNEDIATGGNILISNQTTDLTFEQDWYNLGYSVRKLFNQNEFAKIQSGIEDAVKRVIRQELRKNPTNFRLIDYHRFILSDQDHFKIVSRTRDLFAEDFNFPVLECIQKLSRLINIKLTDYDYTAKQRMHIIIRINRPNSQDFNPPHKDVYGPYDRNPKDFIKFINFWIPICGVTENSSLPIVPKSHLLPESVITRTRSGAQLKKSEYRVNMILDWANSNKLERAKVKNGEVLIFSSHLIHGLALNHEKNQTRVSLEFRLFKDEK